MKKIITIIVLGSLIIWGLLSWFDKVDNSLMNTGITYNECVLELYGVTPSEYLSMKGVMPECEEVCHPLSYYTDHKIPARDISNKCFNEIYSFKLK